MITENIIINNEIMATDIFISVSSDKFPRENIVNDINKAIDIFRDFENKYSRFKVDNELFKLNSSESSRVSEELFEILEKSQCYHKLTNGLFDVSVLNLLEKQGYVLSKNRGFYDENINFGTISSEFGFDKVKLDKKSLMVNKSKNLRFDLGGIGKGYVVDKVAKIIKSKYVDFCVSAGGDMYLSGVDREKDYKYWAIEIESPNGVKQEEMPVLLVSNKAIATSGINKRKWLFYGKENNHLIDTSTGESIANNLDCVTVIGKDTVFCDVMAKTLMIMGVERGLEYCNNNDIAAIFIGKGLDVYKTREVEKYVWKEK